MTYDDELDARCAPLLALLDEAHVPYSREPGETADEAYVLLRPTLQVWQVSQCNQRWIEHHLRTTTPEAIDVGVIPNIQWNSPWGVIIRLHALTMYVQFGRHRACIHYRFWQLGVQLAILKHGYYDPATNHTPPPGRELDALESREGLRDLYNSDMPGFGDVLSGQRPTTAEGRRLLWHRTVDPDTGEETWVNDADIPDEEEDDDAND